MDDDLVTGMAKLATTESPVSVLRKKYEFQRLKSEAARLRRELDHGVDVPAPAATWWGRLLGRKQLVNRRPVEDLVRAQLVEMKASLDKMGKDLIEGILTPLTVSDDYEIQASYYKVRRHVAKSLPEEVTPEGEQARQEAIDFASNHALLAKKVECALKVSTGTGKDQQLAIPIKRLLTMKEASAIDPRIMAEIMAQYSEAFVLTEEELGKSQAPNPGS